MTNLSDKYKKLRQELLKDSIQSARHQALESRLKPLARKPEPKKGEKK